MDQPRRDLSRRGFPLRTDEMRALIFVSMLLIVLPLLGALGFMLVEGWGFFDSLYMAVITLTTVGFAEVRELGTGGRIVVIVYLVLGLGVFFYSISHVGELVIRGELGRTLGRRRMDSTIRSLNDHYIVCGCGRMGRNLCRLLAERKEPFVVVDRDPDAVDFAQDRGWPFVSGDATEDQTLELLGVDRARGLAAVLAGDADNLFVVISTRLMNPDLKILARASEERSVSKMERAGADQVINVHSIGATKMVQLLTNPNLVDFMEILTAKDHEFDVAQISVSADFPHLNQTLSDVDLGARGISIVAIRRKDGELILLPEGATRVRSDDTLTAMGPAEALADFIEGG